MTIDPGEDEPPTDDGARYQIDARGAKGVQAGQQNSQINYFYNGTWTDGVAAAPLVTMSGTIASPYRGLSAFTQSAGPVRSVAFSPDGAVLTVVSADGSVRQRDTGYLVDPQPGPAYRNACP